MPCFYGVLTEEKLCKLKEITDKGAINELKIYVSNGTRLLGSIEADLEIKTLPVQPFLFTYLPTNIAFLALSDPKCE